MSSLPNNDEKTPPSEEPLLETTTTGPTKMIYHSYEGNFQQECDATILACQWINDKEVELTLDQTVLHAQGGGQPTDLGVISVINDNDNEHQQRHSISISKVLLDRSTQIAKHTGTWMMTTNSQGEEESIAPQPATTPTSLPFCPGTPVHVSVDWPNRQLLSECHTAGHVVDSAMAQCQRLLPPLKAYHYLQGPYVEYRGTIPIEERDDVLSQLQAAFQELVAQDIPTQIAVYPQTEAQDVCNRVAANYFDLANDFGNPETVRIVTVAHWPCPCGGTHVASTKCLQARQWGITSLKCKKGVVRVKYNVNWETQKKK